MDLDPKSRELLELELIDTAHAALLRLTGLAATERRLQAMHLLEAERHHLLRAPLPGTQPAEARSVVRGGPLFEP